MQQGCARKNNQPHDLTTNIGRRITSYDSHAAAAISGNTDAAIILAQQQLGPLQDMFIMADQRAKRCW